MKIYGEKKRAFLISDTAVARLYWINENGTVEKTMEGVSACFDFWQKDDGTLLFAHYGDGCGDGFTIVDKNGKTAGDYRGAEGEVFSVQPLENGNFLTAELRHKALREVTADGKVVREIPVAYDAENPHEAMRMARKVRGGYLVVQPGLNEIKRLDEDGKVISAYAIHPDAFGVADLPEGHLLYTCMSGAYELDAEGREVWSLTEKDVPSIGIRWLLGVQILPNGNYIFSNWMGHGHRDEGMMFFEITREKKVVWIADGRGEMLEPAVLQALDVPFADVVK